MISNIIKGSLRKIGVVASGEEPTNDQYNDALDVINRMLYFWSSGSDGIHAIKTESFNLVSGQAEYTYGSGGDFDSARPIHILDCWIRDNGVDFRVLETTYQNYADIGDKDIETYPKVYLHNSEYPKAKLTFYPVPADSYPIFFNARKPLSQYSSSTDAIDLPPEYEEAIEFNLAIRLAPEYQTPVSQVVAMKAEESFNQLRKLHSQPVPQINTDIMSNRSRSYNIYEDN